MKTISKTKNKKYTTHSHIGFSVVFNSKEIDFSITQGKVIIKGTVDTCSRKADIEKVVSEIYGVTSVKNQITVQPTSNIMKSDKDLSDVISNAFNQLEHSDNVVASVNVYHEKRYNDKVRMFQETKTSNEQVLDYWEIFAEKEISISN